MNVLSLFDGKSSGYTALELAGFKDFNYYSSEVDKYAIKASEAIHPNQTRLGDVQTINYQMLPKIDLLIAGSPCQGFSLAGKQLAFDDPRSALFFEFVHALRELNPKYFMLENVKMKKEYQDAISDLLGVQPVRINSSLVSGMLRDRFYWTNIEGIEQPEDKNRFFQDYLDSDLARIDKAPTLTATYYKGGGEATRQRNFIKCQRPIAWINDSTTRHLTPRECFRLQTVPEHYIDKILDCGVSNTQLYKIAGNGWTDEVVAHIFKGMEF